MSRPSAIYGSFMNKNVQRNAAEVRRRYGRAAERRFWVSYCARELFDAGPYIFIGLIGVLLFAVALG
jgi:hypothetical protein